MNSTMWTYFFMVVGILGIVLMNLFSDLMIQNEQDTFLLKEITEAAMIDSFDRVGFRIGLGYDGVTPAKYPDSMYCDKSTGPGVIRIKTEKFVESFIFRFAESVSADKTYEISFDDIDECPPKVAVTIKAKDKYSFLEFFRVSYDGDEEVINNVVGILEVFPEYDED